MGKEATSSLTMRKLRQILLIDDDEVNNYINETLLNELHIAQQVVVLTNGRLALEHLRTNCLQTSLACPQLVILDYQMPEMDGMELLRALKGLPSLNGAEMVFLLLASHVRGEDIEEFK